MDRSVVVLFAGWCLKSTAAHCSRSCRENKGCGDCKHPPARVGYVGCTWMDSLELCLLTVRSITYRSSPTDRSRSRIFVHAKTNVHPRSLVLSFCQCGLSPSWTSIISRISMQTLDTAHSSSLVPKMTILPTARAQEMCLAASAALTELSDSNRLHPVIAIHALHLRDKKCCQHCISLPSLCAELLPLSSKLMC